MNITGGKYNSRIIKTKDYANIKPTLSKTRQGIFNTLSSMIDFDGKVFVDMFSGSGIMSLEALSRGFTVYSFEKDPKTVKAIKAVFAELKETPNIYTGDALKNLPKSGVKADVIFLDPPYASDLYSQALDVIKANDILTPEGIIAAEHPETVPVMPHDGFETIKVKEYADKRVTYIKRADF